MDPVNVSPSIVTFRLSLRVSEILPLFYSRGGALNLQDLEMSDHKKTMTGNRNTWKMMDQIAALEFARPGKWRTKSQGLENAGPGKWRTLHNQKLDTARFNTSAVNNKLVLHPTYSLLKISPCSPGSRWMTFRTRRANCSCKCAPDPITSQTDRQTERRHPIAIPRFGLYSASRGKKNENSGGSKRRFTIYIY